MIESKVVLTGETKFELPKRKSQSKATRFNDFEGEEEKAPIVGSCVAANADADVDESRKPAC